MKPEKKDIEKIMGSLSGADRARPNPFLYGKIVNRINKPGSAPAPFKWILQGSLAVILLTGLNIFGIVTYNELQPEKEDTNISVNPWESEFMEEFQNTDSNVYFTYNEE